MGEAWRVIEAFDGSFGVQMGDDGGFIFHPEIDGHKNKAHLIAAAPEMYEMIEKIAELIKSEPNEISLADEVASLSCELRDLLAKARGEG